MNARVVDAFKTCNFQQKFLVVSGWIDIFLVLVIPALSHVLTIHTIAQPLSYFLQTISKANTRFHCQITPSGSEHETLYERQHERLSPRCPNLQGHACVCVCVCVGREASHPLSSSGAITTSLCSLTHSLTHPLYTVRFPGKYRPGIVAFTSLRTWCVCCGGVKGLLLSNVNAKADRYAPYSPPLCLFAMEYIVRVVVVVVAGIFI